MTPLRKSLLVRYSKGGVVDEYSPTDVWSELSAMHREGLVLMRGRYTMCASVTLTDDGCAALAAQHDTSGGAA